jgi:hypothetical protein
VKRPHICLNIGPWQSLTTIRAEMDEAGAYPAENIGDFARNGCHRAPTAQEEVVPLTGTAWHGSDPHALTSRYGNTSSRLLNQPPPCGAWGSHGALGRYSGVAHGPGSSALLPTTGPDGWRARRLGPLRSAPWSSARSPTPSPLSQATGSGWSPRLQPGRHRYAAPDRPLVFAAHRAVADEPVSQVRASTPHAHTTPLASRQT